MSSRSRSVSYLARFALAAATSGVLASSCYDFDAAFDRSSSAGGPGGAASSTSALATSAVSGSTGAQGGAVQTTASSASQTTSATGGGCTCAPPGHCEGTTCVCPASITTEERLPGSAEGTSNGNKGWVGAGNILTYDNAYASVTLDNMQTSELLIGHSFSFADIPATASIQNVELRIYRCRTVVTAPVTVKDTVVQLVVGGVATGPSLSGAAWGADCSSPAQYGFDSGSIALSPAQLLGDFGAEVRIRNFDTGKAVGNVDAMTLSVTYVPTCQ